ncbi:hypothetical protein D3C87_253150 [compost metagenome]
MPGSKSPSIVDWNEWGEDDEFLRFLISREAIGLPLSRDSCLEAVKDAIKEVSFKRPYLDNSKYGAELYQYLGKYASPVEEKKYRFIEIVYSHPDGKHYKVLQCGLSIQEAIKSSSSYVLDGGLPYFEEDI